MRWSPHNQMHLQQTIRGGFQNAAGHRQAIVGIDDGLDRIYVVPVVQEIAAFCEALPDCRDQSVIRMSLNVVYVSFNVIHVGIDRH